MKDLQWVEESDTVWDIHQSGVHLFTKRTKVCFLPSDNGFSQIFCNWLTSRYIFLVQWSN